MKLKVVYRIAYDDTTKQYKGQQLCEELGKWENVSASDLWHSTRIAAATECFENYTAVIAQVKSDRIQFEYDLKDGVYEYSERLYVLTPRKLMVQLLAAASRIVQESVCVADKPVHEVLKVDIDALNRLIFQVSKHMDDERPMAELNKVYEERAEAMQERTSSAVLKQGELDS